MKLVLAILFIINVSFLRAQTEITSFYFSEPQPKAASSVEKFDESVCGRYLYEDDTLISMVITPDSMYTHFGTFTFVTRKELKKSKKLKIEDELLFGIKDGQGIPYIEKNDTIFTYVTQDDLVFKPGKNHQLNQNGDNFYLNSKEENGYYSTVVLSVKNNKLVLYTVDHEIVLEEILNFTSTKTKEVDGFKTYISAPTKNEFILFVENQGFKDKTVYLDSENL